MMALQALTQPSRAALALVCLLGIWLRVANLGNVAQRTPDERVYTHQAKVWLEFGQAGIRKLVDQYQHDPVVRYYPMPTRAGIIRLVALAQRTAGRADESAGAAVSCLASILSLVIVAIMAARFLPPWGALFAVLFYAVSPAELAIARRLWPDAIAELPATLAVWMACETAVRSRLLAYLLFALAGAAGLAVRETFPAFLVFYLLWMVWVLAVDRRERAAAVLLVALTGVASAGALLWLGSAIGSLPDFVRMAGNGSAVNAVNDYALRYASGPPWLVLDAFWIASPIAALCTAAGFCAAFAGRREKPYGRVLAGLGLATGACLLLMMCVPHYINLRYFSLLYGPLYLLAGYGFWCAARICGAWLAERDRALVATLSAAVILGAAIGDYLRFQRFFVRDSTPDLSIRMLQIERDR